MLQYIKYVYLFRENSGCLFSKYFFFIISKQYQPSVSPISNIFQLLKWSVMPLLVLCGIQIIYGLKSQPFEYILSMVVCFLPKGIYIVFVYMDSNILGNYLQLPYYWCVQTYVLLIYSYRLCLLSFVLSTYSKQLRVIECHTILY